MNPLLLILIEAGFKIGASHMGSGGGTVIKTADFIMDAARALDDLYKEETGEPLDWSKIRLHEHLPPAGSSPTLPGISETPETSESEDPSLIDPPADGE
jgi:hypothetical protein